MPTGEFLTLATVCVEGLALRTVKQLISSAAFIDLKTEAQRYFADVDDALPFSELPDVCLIDFDQDWEKGALTAERICRLSRRTAVFALSSNSPPDRIIHAMQCGCQEYLMKPLDPQVLMDAMLVVWRKKREKSDRPAGQVLAFVGTKGGCGVTTIVTHIGAVLARDLKRKTLLIDYHPQMGDASFYLALTNPQYHFTDLVENPDRLDADFLQGFLVQHVSGMDVLPSPDKRKSGEFSADGVERTLEFLRSKYEFVLADCPPGLGPSNMAMINRADQVCLVAVPEIPALRNATRYLDTLVKRGYAMDRVRLVVNRHSTEGPLSDAAIERAIHKNIDWKVPNEYDAAVETINSGRPASLSETSELMRNLTNWANLIAEKKEPARHAPSADRKHKMGPELRLRIVGGN